MAFLSTVMLRCATNPFLLSPDQLYCERPLRTSFGLDCHDTDQANLNFSTRYVYGAGSGTNSVGTNPLPSYRRSSSSSSIIIVVASRCVEPRCGRSSIFSWREVFFYSYSIVRKIHRNNTYQTGIQLSNIHA